MLENLKWAEPLCSVIRKKEEENNTAVKFYTDLRDEFAKTIKKEFDGKVKIAKN